MQIERHRRTLLVILSITVQWSALAFGATGEVMKWESEGARREALVFPASRKDGSGKSTEIFAFHWHGGTMQEAAAEMRFQNLWPEAIVVYMQGLRTRIYVDPLGFH